MLNPLLDPPPRELEALKVYLRKMGVPSELLPEQKTQGAKSYTVRHKDHPGSVQILHSKRMYYLNYDKSGNVPVDQSHQWAHHGGAQEAWDYVKKTYDMW